MTFFQQSDFKISMIGIFLEFFLAKGWPSCAILSLKTVVDPTISYLGISMFIIVQCLNQMVASNVMAHLVNKFDVSPSSKDPDVRQQYGYIMTAMTTIPCLICVPFFFIAGLKMRQIKKGQEKGLKKEEIIALRRRDTVFISNFLAGETAMDIHGGNDEHVNTFKELKQLKKPIKRKSVMPTNRKSFADDLMVPASISSKNKFSRMKTLNVPSDF